MITEERAEKAIEFIRDNAERYGELVGLCKSLEHQRKVIHAHCFIDSSGTVAERSAKAYASPEFKSVCEDIENAWAEKTTLETKLKAAELTHEKWRSQNKAHKDIDRAHR